MRHPNVHQALRWFAPSVLVFFGGVIGIVIAAAQVWDGAKNWAEAQFSLWWPVMTSGWFVAAAIIVIALYIIALVYTGSGGGSAPDPNEPVNGKLRSLGYFLSFNTSDNNPRHVTEGFSPVPLENISDHRIDVEILSFDCRINGKTAPNIGDLIVGEIFTIEPHCVVRVHSKPIEIDFVGPGRFDGEVHIDALYGKHGENRTIRLTRKYEIAHHVPVNGDMATTGVERP